ncbi:MAG TPA: type II secretion system protein [Bdellovibrionota bacterium]|jgi:prepilin-type N-terminal cleavage/methylation domain-containing protein
MMRNQRGFTLLEVMFALGILIVGTYLAAEGVNQIEDLSKDTRTLSATERQINLIVDNIRTGLGNYQISYDYSREAKEELLDLKKLPMAWAAGVVEEVAKCEPKKTCPQGRYGFVVQPVERFRGLYTVTLRMTHKDWKEPYRDYEFLVTVQ